MQFKGTFTALITPFNSQGELDEEGLRRLIQMQLQNQINGIVVLGTTGEAPTLSAEEKKRTIIIARQEMPQDIALIVGTGSNSTKQTIENTLQAEQLGADAALIVTPYYNKPTQEGLYQHFKAVAEAATLPIIVYNIQARTGQNLQTETLKRLAEIPTIIAIKEASGNISQIIDVIEMIRLVRSDFRVLSGDDALILPLIALGGDGVISVISNLMPKEVKELVESSAAGNFELARKMHYQLMPLIKAVFIETNPIPIKTAMRLCRLPAGECRLPLCEMRPENILHLEKVLTTQSLIDNDHPLNMRGTKLALSCDDTQIR